MAVLKEEDEKKARPRWGIAVGRVDWWSLTFHDVRGNGWHLDVARVRFTPFALLGGRSPLQIIVDEVEGTPPVRVDAKRWRWSDNESSAVVEWQNGDVNVVLEVRSDALWKQCPLLSELRGNLRLEIHVDEFTLLATAQMTGVLRDLRCELRDNEVVATMSFAGDVSFDDGQLTTEEPVDCKIIKPFTMGTALPTVKLRCPELRVNSLTLRSVVLGWTSSAKNPETDPFAARRRGCVVATVRALEGSVGETKLRGIEATFETAAAVARSYRVEPDEGNLAIARPNIGVNIGALELQQDPVDAIVKALRWSDKDTPYVTLRAANVTVQGMSQGTVVLRRYDDEVWPRTRLEVDVFSETRRSSLRASVLREQGWNLAMERGSPQRLPADDDTLDGGPALTLDFRTTRADFAMLAVARGIVDRYPMSRLTAQVDVVDIGDAILKCVAATVDGDSMEFSAGELALFQEGRCTATTLPSPAAIRGRVTGDQVDCAVVGLQVADIPALCSLEVQRVWTWHLVRPSFVLDDVRMDVGLVDLVVAPDASVSCRLQDVVVVRKNRTLGTLREATFASETVGPVRRSRVQTSTVRLNANPGDLNGLATVLREAVTRVVRDSPIRGEALQLLIPRAHLHTDDHHLTARRLALQVRRVVQAVTLTVDALATSREDLLSDDASDDDDEGNDATPISRTWTWPNWNDGSCETSSSDEELPAVLAAVEAMFRCERGNS